MQVGGRRRGGLARDGGPVGIEAHDARGVDAHAVAAGVVRGQMRAQRGAGEQHRRAGIGEHERQPLRRVVRIERQIGAPGLEDAEQPHQHRQRALDAQPHHHLGPDPERAQVMRQLARARIELAVAQPLILEHHRNRLRRARHLRRKQLRQRRARDRTRGGVPLPQDGVTLPGAQNVELADRLIRIFKRTQKSQEALVKFGQLVGAVQCRIAIEIDANVTTVQAVVQND